MPRLLSLHRHHRNARVILSLLWRLSRFLVGVTGFTVSALYLYNTLRILRYLSRRRRHFALASMHRAHEHEEEFTESRLLCAPSVSSTALSASPASSASSSLCSSSSSSDPDSTATTAANTGQIPLQLVSQEEFEQGLADLTAQIRFPTQGILSALPSPHLEMYFSESLAFIMGGPAALLQLAHPFVAAAIMEHSSLRDDVAQRFHKTFEYMYKTLYGDLDTVLRAARTVYRLHTHVHGHLPVGQLQGSDPEELLSGSSSAGLNKRHHEEKKKRAHLCDGEQCSDPPPEEVDSGQCSGSIDCSSSSSSIDCSSRSRSSSSIDCSSRSSINIDPNSTESTKDQCTGGTRAKKQPQRRALFSGGQRYDALDRHALLWVLATLHEGRETAWELLHHRMPRQHREQCARWLRVVGLAFGVHPSTVPDGERAFRAYYRRMICSRVLCVDQQAAQLKEMLMRPLLWESTDWWRRCIGLNSLSVLTGILLPEPIAKQYGFDTGRASLLYATLLLAALSTLNACLPLSFRSLTQFQQMRVRCARLSDPTAELPLLSRLAERFGTALLQAIFRSHANE